MAGKEYTPAVLRRNHLADAADTAVALGLAAAAWLLYRPVLRLWWTHDDFFHLRYLLSHPAGWYLFDASSFREFPARVFTPLLFLSLDADRRLFGLHPEPFYLHQLAALVLCPVALYALLRLWLPRGWAAAGVLVFLAGPVFASLAPLLMVRHYLEAILLAALAVAFWVAALRRWPGRAAWRLSVLSAVAWFAASMAKEVAVPLALLLPLLPPTREDRGESPRWRLAVPHALALALYLALRFAALGTLLGGYGFSVTPAGLPRLALTLPGKIGTELLGGGWTLPGAVLAVALAAGALVLLRGRRAALVLLAALFLAALPVLPVSTHMEPRYAVPVWIVLAVAFAVGASRLAAGGRIGRSVAVALAVLACAAGLWLNRLDWNVRFARMERMSAENRFLFEMEDGELLRQPVAPPASLRELRWIKEAVFHRPPGGGWFHDDLYLCLHRDGLGRVWGWDPAARRIVDLTRQVPVLRARHCRSIRRDAPLSVDFRVAGSDLFWELGPYAEGRYFFVVDGGVEAVEMPRSAGFQIDGLEALELRIGYRSPAGWVTYSPELRLELADGRTLRWSRAGSGSEVRTHPIVRRSPGRRGRSQGEVSRSKRTLPGPARSTR